MNDKHTHAAGGRILAAMPPGDGSVAALMADYAEYVDFTEGRAALEILVNRGHLETVTLPEGYVLSRHYRRGV